MRTRARTCGLVVGIVLLVALSGCSALGGGDGSCGPGDTDIADVETGDSVTITGEVTATGPASFVIEDGTGQAFVMSGQTDYGTGDCVTVTGTANQLPDGQQADVSIAPQETNRA